MITVENVRVAYAAESGPVTALEGTSCTFRPGIVTAVIGRNGSGKSTLGRLLCAMELPSSGSVAVDGHDPAQGRAERQTVRQLVGFVRQQAANQIVSSLVFDEVAFGPRNLGVAEAGLGALVGTALARCGLAGYEARGTNELSGGEQQLLALAGVLAMQPRYVVLDEPTSQVDSRQRPRVRAIVDALAHQEGLGVILITHEPLEVLCSDEVVVMRAGTVAWRGDPRTLLAQERALWDETLPESPYLDAVARAIAAGWAPACSLTYADPGQLAAWVRSNGVQTGPARPKRTAKRKASWVRTDSPRYPLTWEGVSYSYAVRQKAGTLPVVQHASLTLVPGQVALLAGESGSGKSTLAALGAGLLTADEGIVRLGGSPVAPGWVGLALQAPERQFFLESVGDELAFAAQNLGCDEAEVRRRVDDAARTVKLDRALLERDPFSLSGGQARLAAIASTLTLKAPVYLFDEPSAGLDGDGRLSVHRLARRLVRGGAAVMVISHDVEEWLPHVDRVLLMRAGSVVWDGRAAQLADAAVQIEAFGLCGLEPPPMARYRAALGAGSGGALMEDARPEEGVRS